MALSLTGIHQTCTYDRIDNFLSSVEILQVSQVSHGFSPVSLLSQVGMASLDLSTGRLYLNQYIESSRSNQNTLTLLSFYEPSTIIVSANTITAPEGAVGAASLTDHPRFTSSEKVITFDYRSRKQASQGCTRFLFRIHEAHKDCS